MQLLLRLAIIDRSRGHRLVPCPRHPPSAALLCDPPLQPSTQLIVTSLIFISPLPSGLARAIVFAPHHAVIITPSPLAHPINPVYPRQLIVIAHLQRPSRRRRRRRRRRWR